MNRSQAGQGIVEYALILDFITIAALSFFGTAIAGSLNSTGTSV